MKIIFDFASQTIGIEGDSPELLEVLRVARQLAPALSDITIKTIRPNGQPEAPRQQQAVASGSDSAPRTGRTLRQFVKSLKLNNASEGIAAIAYYKKHNEGCETFAPKEMGAWFTQASLTKPKQMPVAVFHAKKTYGYVTSSGHGKWRISAEGENVVVGKLIEVEEAGAGTGT